MFFKFIILSLIILNTAFARGDQFEKEAKALASDLKSSLMKNLSEKIAKEGPVAAVPFCHANVKPIAKGAAKDRITKYEFGRTSHKLRNAANAPEVWAEQYLKQFEGKKKGEIKKEFILFTLPNSKRVYIEPLYVEAKCLLCHGNNVSKQINEKIQELYPKDQATGFKLGEFRGFIWVKEK
jgi:hypothetical protein